MATMKVYRNGLSTSTGGVGMHKREPRGRITGWNAATARRQTQWLWTVDAESLSGFGYAVTLTLGDCPPDAATFHALRTNWLKRLARMGSIRTHWVIEWQARGVPHLHAAVYFDRQLTPVEVHALIAHWCQIAAPYSVNEFAQYILPISGPVGWLKYLAKHAARGANHYQRSGHPDGWATTGRLWGHTGAWETVEPILLDELNAREFWRLRRLMRAWAVADARKAGDWSRVAYLRRAGRPADRTVSSYLGISEWIPESVSLRLVELFLHEH